MTLQVGSIIPKVDMGTQIRGAINLCEAVTYIDSSYATSLRSSRYVESFFITLFGSAAYYKSDLKVTVATSSTEAEFMATVSGDKASKYISSILDEM